MQENLSMRPVLGVVLAVEERMAQVRLFLAGGGVVEERLPSIGANLLEAGAAVVVIFLGDDPSSGVIVDESPEDAGFLRIQRNSYAIDQTAYDQEQPSDYEEWVGRIQHIPSSEQDAGYHLP